MLIKNANCIVDHGNQTLNGILLLLPTHSTGKKKKHEFITQKAFVLELIEELSYFSQEDGQA